MTDLSLARHIGAILARAGEDADPAETAEWCEALDALTRGARPGARALPARRAARARAPARRALAAVADRRRTSTRSPLEEQPPFPGDLAIEERLAALMRWNALAMVVRANRANGGSANSAGTSRATRRRPTCSRSASTISSAARGEPASTRGDLVFFQPHSAPGVYARAFLEGRLSEERPRPLSPGADRAGARRARPVVVSASVADAGLLAVPDRLDGHRSDQRDLPGALHALPAASRPAADATAGARCGASSATARWTSPNRSRALSLAAREQLDNLHLRHQLQPAAPRRSGARQRPHHRRARGAVRRRRLERDQAAVGLGLGRAVRARPRPARCCAPSRTPSTASSRPSRPRTARSTASTSSARTPSCRRSSRTCATRTSTACAAAATMR